jgi:hypothetical protein
MPQYPTDFAYASTAVAAAPAPWRLLVLRASRIWLILGLLLLLLAPSLLVERGPLGWWPYWLVLAPLVNLVGWRR